MNCRKNDLAYIVATGRPAYDSRLVQIDASYGEYPDSIYGGHHWWVRPQGWEPPDCWLDRHGRFILPDAILRPIRDNDSEDESLAWAGKPAQKDTPRVQRWTHAQRWPA
jgi:hypothetical protein